jgi:hypothetical protein
LKKIIEDELAYVEEIYLDFLQDCSHFVALKEGKRPPK